MSGYLCCGILNFEIDEGDLTFFVAWADSVKSNMDR